MLMAVIPKVHTKRRDGVIGALSAYFEDPDFDFGFLLN
jgi:hypothetical protein